jgi:hypothetical protein
VRGAAHGFFGGDFRYDESDEVSSSTFAPSFGTSLPAVHRMPFVRNCR